MLNVAIVGGGLSGLTTLKQCLAEGSKATVFEPRSDVGGQWNYEEHPKPILEGKNSNFNNKGKGNSTSQAFTTNIYEGVVLNSCRDTTHFSDFPIDPARYPDFFGHRLFKQYIDEYVEYFGLKQHVRLNTTVLSCSVTESGQWVVRSRTTKATGGNAKVQEETYDAVFACTGRVSTPLIPDLKGKERFRGELMHSHLYRRPGRFEGKRVAVIGFGNSAADIACEIGAQAKELHLVTRRGGYIVPRYAFGMPAEAFNNRLGEAVLPARITDTVQTAILRVVMGDLPKEVKPQHAPHQANITVRGDLLENIKVGRITVHKTEIDELTETGLKLSNGEDLKVDAIICCTGYRMDFPYLHLEDTDGNDCGVVDSRGGLHLYKLIVPPELPNLFFIGFFELPGPAVPVVETQARWATAVLAGRVQLPSVPDMYTSIRKYQNELASKMINSERHTTSIRFLPYCDDLLSPLGAAPTLHLLLSQMLRSRNPLPWLRIIRAVYLGLSSPAQYRLFGEGANTELAMATLLRLASGKDELSNEEKEILALGKRE